jgi:hypothetical protein
MNDFDVDKPLPLVIAINCAENHLYRIGLSLFFNVKAKSVKIFLF